VVSVSTVSSVSRAQGSTGPTASIGASSFFGATPLGVTFVVFVVVDVSVLVLLALTSSAMERPKTNRAKAPTRMMATVAAACVSLRDVFAAAAERAAKVAAFSALMADCSVAEDSASSLSMGEHEVPRIENATMAIRPVETLIVFIFLGSGSGSLLSTATAMIPSIHYGSFSLFFHPTSWQPFCEGEGPILVRILVAFLDRSG